MNLIVGFLLIISEGNELDIFYLLISNFSSTFIEPKKNIFSFRGLYTDGFPLLYFLNFIFDNLLESNIPEVKEHLDNLGITSDFWMSQWIQTLFTIVLPVNWLKRLWDCIFADNIYFVVKFAIVFTKLLKDEILSRKEENIIVDYFKQLQKYSLFPENKHLQSKGNIDDLILKAQKIKINPDNYIKMYKKENEDFDTFSQKMEKNNKVIFKLEKGDLVKNKNIIKKSNTVIFHDPEEENIISNETKKINEIKSDEKKIKKNIIQENQKEDIKIQEINKEDKNEIKIQISKKVDENIIFDDNKLIIKKPEKNIKNENIEIKKHSSPEKIKKETEEIPSPTFYKEENNYNTIKIPKCEINEVVDKTTNKDIKINKSKKGHVKQNKYFDLGQIINSDEEKEPKKNNNNIMIINQKKEPNNIYKMKYYFENKNIIDEENKPSQFKKMNQYNFNNVKSNNNIKHQLINNNFNTINNNNYYINQNNINYGNNKMENVNKTNNNMNKFGIQNNFDNKDLNADK